ncbi:hypothetical protein AK812_SmicGene1982 [Symbiodinium microadriaticum]|uniref:Uncharacterized protein n=1 Tax=Symbiodinium microadriaticum TaxID=2951 RepID=A0A1Q9F2R7_SYMMI|nr:hypothetical protein AK812_SmicGene1982 [Symbiodinium microadriaticum]
MRHRGLVPVTSAFKKSGWVGSAAQRNRHGLVWVTGSPLEHTAVAAPVALRSEFGRDSQAEDPMAILIIIIIIVIIFFIIIIIVIITAIIVIIIIIIIIIIPIVVIVTLILSLGLTLILIIIITINNNINIIAITIITIIITITTPSPSSVLVQCLEKRWVWRDGLGELGGTGDPMVLRCGPFAGLNLFP